MRTDSPAFFPDLTAELLRKGSCVRFRAIGASMQPTIEDGELITVAPVGPAVKRGDILLYRNERGVFAHRVVRVLKGTVPLPGTRCSSCCNGCGDCPRYLLRGDAGVSYDPSVALEQVLGRVVAVQRAGRNRPLDNRALNTMRLMRLWISSSRAFRLLHLKHPKRIKKL